MVDQSDQERARIQREITAEGLRRLEVEARANEAWKIRLPMNIELAATPYVRHSVTGRYELQPPAGLVAIGRLFRQARLRSGMSQQRLADKCGVSQSMISRFERGLAPAMGVRHLVAMANALGPIFPFGICPHEHECGWQPYKPTKTHTSYVTAWLDAMRPTEPRPEPSAKSDLDLDLGDRDLGDRDLDGEPLITVTLADLSVGSEDDPAE